MSEFSFGLKLMRCRTTRLPWFIIMCFAVGLVSACSDSNIKAKVNLHSANDAPESLSTPSKQDGSPKRSFIRQVDFGNFTYPSLPTKKCSMDQIHLENGQCQIPEHVAKKGLPNDDCWSVVIVYVDYGDVTGDAVEEAIVVLYAELGGTEGSQDVFIYASQSGTPELLWKFATGDRADGGLRRIYAENGEMIIELYGVGTMIGKELFGTNSVEVGSCCPKHYTRTKYKWIDHRFQQDGKSEVFSNPSGAAVTLMPRYEPSK